MSLLPRLTANEALVPGALKRAGYIDPDEVPRQASRGQIMILFALFLTAMLGVLGLAMDVGYAVSQRRMMQNAADLAAISGALSVANYSENNIIAALTTVQSTIDGNQTHEGSPALEVCNYVNDALATVASCDAVVPSAATGVSVRVRETHNTFFIRAVPGAPEEVSTRASATARVERLFRAGMDAPFIVCGYDTKRMDGSEVSILSNDTTVNQDALGETFRIMGTASGTNPTIASCGLDQTGVPSPLQWKGLALNQTNSPNNDSRELNQKWLGKGVGSPGRMKFNIIGLEGCQQGDAAPFNCVLLLPVATNTVEPTKIGGSYFEFHVVKVLGFLVSSCGANCYQATLLDDYPTFGGSVPGWCRDCGAVTVIKLKE